MAYRDQWLSLSRRIRGLTQAGELHARFLSVRSNDGYGRSALLRQQCEAVLTELQSFRDQFASSLPFTAKSCVEGFIAARSDLIKDTSGGADSREERVWAALVMFGAFETEMNFILSDTQETLRSRADRAFEHLQRMIVVDMDFKAKWLAAFGRDEQSCEQLGGVHLLLHGIWAFKANAEGERTDLVYQEPIVDLDTVERSAEGLVLTEWKRATDGDDPARRFEEARRQVNLYSQGSLAGFELTAYRYAVVVSRKRVAVPNERRERNVAYRFVNIAVDPDTPSRDAKKASASPPWGK
jgi:hypothetical protein